MKTVNMRSVVVALCLLIGTLSMQAGILRGIRIESAAGSIVVYLNGDQVCTASSSCFIANLSGGSYEIKVYDARSSGRDERGRDEGLLFSERINYSGMGIKEIFIKSDAGHRPSRPGRPGGGAHQGNIMNRETFETFYRSVKGKPFDSDRTELIETVLINSDFTSAQCRRLMDAYTFDNDRIKAMQLMYPRISDKEGFFVVTEGLTFQSDKEKVNNFIKKYHSQRN